jgi:hypothetical protein
MQFDLITISSKFREGEYAISSHADDEMENDDVPIDLLVEAIGRDNPKIIEKYQYSCLILGWGSPTELLHAVIALGTVKQIYDTPVLVTIYRPDKDPEKRWKGNYAKRKKKIFGCLF